MNGHLRENALGLGADYFGVADLTLAGDFVTEQGGEMLASFPRAVSIGVRMPAAIVDQLPQHQERLVALAYRGHSYDVLNSRLDQIASALASALQREGHRVFPIRASARPIADQEQLRDIFSHKLAAHLAGLGWIGKSCLLVTPEVGPRVRWATILTDAPLTPGQPLEERCGKCRECVEACPAQAFSDRNFCEDEPREVRYDVHKCNAYIAENGERVGVRVCGMCVYACPLGKERKCD